MRGSPIPRTSTRASRDHGPAAFLNDCDQCDVVDKVDIHERLDFGLSEVASYSKETAVKGLSAASSGGCDPASIAQRCRIVGCFQHDRQRAAAASSLPEAALKDLSCSFKEQIPYLSVPNNVSTACMTKVWRLRKQ